MNAKKTVGCDANGPSLGRKRPRRASRRPHRLRKWRLRRKAVIGVSTHYTLLDNRAGGDHGPRVWLGEPVREMAVFSEQYDFAISLLLLEDARPFVAAPRMAAL
jgi:hypothetical protein